MFQRFHAMKERKESGFTLIELLVVILIIAILAAIAIPVFLNQRKKGWISQSQSALKNAATATETCATENNGSYTTCTDPTAFGFSTTSDVVVTVSGDDQQFCVTATHDLLDGDVWEVSTYDSNVGNPTEANTCGAAPVT